MVTHNHFQHFGAFSMTPHPRGVHMSYNASAYHLVIVIVVIIVSASQVKALGPSTSLRFTQGKVPASGASSGPFTEAKLLPTFQSCLLALTQPWTASHRPQASL